jgi:PiT family inorganic phosphate transporter
VLNIAGAFMSTAVAKMIGGGIVEASMIQQTTVIAALSGAIAWNLFTLILGLPTSSSHALIGGIIGGALAQSGMAAVKLSGLQKVLEAMLFSPLVGFVLGYLIILATYWVMFRVPRGAANRGFRRLQLISSSFMAFSHGANDAQKAMGIITLSLVSAGYLNSVEVPTWVILACAVAMGLGTAAGGWRIVRTMGMRIMKMEPVHGFAAETSAALILLGTAHFGIPVSTTHTITSSIMGVGSVTRLSAVRWGVTMRIVYAWLFTLPGAGLVAYGATLAFQALR